MSTECSPVGLEFHPLNQRRIRAQFDGGAITSDGGGLMLREVEKRTGILRGDWEFCREELMTWCEAEAWSTPSEAAKKVRNADRARRARPMASQTAYAEYRSTPSPLHRAESMT